LAIEARSASLFSDSIAFLEAASVSVLVSSGRNWSMPGREAFARFSRTIILIPTSFLFWMIAANCYGTAIPSAAPLAATGAAVLSCPSMAGSRIRPSRSPTFAIMRS
jgi:hypothetical protein